MPKQFDYDGRGNNKRTSNSAYTGDLDLIEDGFLDDIRKPSGIVRRDDGALELNGIVLSPIGIQFTPNTELSEEEFVTLGQMILMINNALQWVVGDYFAYGEKKEYGARNQLAEQLNVDPHTITNWTTVCRSVEYARRRALLDFGHHQAVAALAPSEQDGWLERAIIGNGLEGDKYRRWSVQVLRKAIAKVKGEKQEVKLKQSKLPTSLERFDKSFTAQQYNRMTVDERIEFRQRFIMYIQQMDEWDKGK